MIYLIKDALTFSVNSSGDQLTLSAMLFAVECFVFICIHLQLINMYIDVSINSIFCL